MKTIPNDTTIITITSIISQMQPHL